MQPVIIESKPNPRAVAPIVAEVFPGIPEPEQEYVWNPAFSLLKMKPPLP